MARLRDLPLVRVPAITAAQMAEIDAVASAAYGIDVAVLMENAARGIAFAARAYFGGRVAERRIVALAGPGNNGGDALAAARYLANWGAVVTAALAVTGDQLRPLSRRQLDALVAAGGDVSESVDVRALAVSDLVLDGLLGYSVSGPPRGTIAALIAAANGAGAPILAIDLPSGLDPDSGTRLDGCVVAAL